ncbi:rubrerythrin family protein [Halarsenatibacter silvermanii]|uniref:Rubrerythrin n=1 Tax=Halarsenatibacter silvermanii TaxID=321763 RepID=A0A1G9I266_9FIRM|nr:rubrerythrin family protein [Halarsenatibacter silvermanii]SDL19299.1 Rubrerythrin [Halarsenatibacter silvermanii]
MVENDMTSENLRSAFGGESQAYQRYQVWGSKADEEGYPMVATLFKAVAHAEQVHARNHFEAMDNVQGDHLVASGAVFGLNDTAENLAGAIEGERHEIDQMYPAYSLVAKNQEENEAVKTFHYALEAEKAHADLFSEAKEAVERGSDYDIDYLGVCEVCGFTIKNEIPDYCPICGESHDEFEKFS